MEKLYITYEETHNLIEKISHEIHQDKWMPDCMVAIAAGGFIPSRLLRNYFNLDIYIVGLKRYIEEQEAHDIPIKIQWIDEVERKITGKKILLVDEIDDTRTTLAYCIEELLSHNPEEIRIAVLHQKLKDKNAQFPKEIQKIYSGAQVNDIWIQYPWETRDLMNHNEQNK